MATLSVAVKVESARANARLRELARKTSNLPGGLKIVGEALLKEQNRRFDVGEAPSGAKWAPLKPLTVMTRGGATGPILKRSGALKASGSYRVAGTVLRVGLAGRWAQVHQEGRTIVPKKGTRLAIPIPAARGGRNRSDFAFAKKVTIPARPMVGFGPRDEKATDRAIRQWLALGS